MKKRNMLGYFLLAPDGGASGSAGSDGAGNGGTGVQAQEAAAPEVRAKRNPLSEVHYGKEAPGEQDAGQAAAVRTEAPQEQPEDFESLINGRYKKDFDARVQGIVKERLRNHKEAEATLTGLRPMLEAMAKKHGMEAFDPDNAEMLKTLSSKVVDDNSLYEEEALARGIPVETLKELKALERDKTERERTDALNREAEAVKNHLQGLMTQAEQVKTLYPGFDLRAELQGNPDFLRLTSPEVGVDVRTAYEITHRNEIMPQIMQVAAQKTQQQLSQAMQAQARRPQENALQGAPGVESRPDPSKWTKQDREEIRRRVARGEKIYL